MIATFIPDALDRFLYWMEERQRIYLRRQSGQPWPWTDDPILQRYRFCNVYREQDRTTTWIRENWREPYADHPNLWFAMCIARQINYIDTLADIGFPEQWQPHYVYAVMQKREALGLKVFTSAYMVGGGSPRGTYKIEYIVWRVLNQLWESTRNTTLPWDRPNCTLELATLFLSKFRGFGMFLAYEVVTDMRHTRYLCNAPDINTWANPGPGAVRGLNRLTGRSLQSRPGRKQLIDEMRELLQIATARTDPAILPNLEMRDIEMSLCEFDKYERLRTGGGTLGTGRVGVERYCPAGLGLGV
jgi:hypothetical protein